MHLEADPCSESDTRTRVLAVRWGGKPRSCGEDGGCINLTHRWAGGCQWEEGGVEASRRQAYHF